MIYQNSFQNWIFDLDNTLYDINLGLFKKISNRITDFIMSKYSLDIDQAKKIQKTLENQAFFLFIMIAILIL